MTAQASQIFGFPEAPPAMEQPAATADCQSRMQLNPENVRNGLAQLVLTVVELLSRVARTSGTAPDRAAGSLTDGEVERLGATFLQLAEEIERLKQYFGFTDEDLNLNLGPLGKLR